MCTIDDNNNDNNHGHETATTFRFVQIGAFCSLLFRVFLSFLGRGREEEGGGEIRQDTKHVFDRKVETEFELFLISSETGQDLEMDIWIVLHDCTNFECNETQS